MVITAAFYLSSKNSNPTGVRGRFQPCIPIPSAFFLALSSHRTCTVRLIWGSLVKVVLCLDRRKNLSDLELSLMFWSSLLEFFLLWHKPYQWKFVIGNNQYTLLLFFVYISPSGTPTPTSKSKLLAG